MFGLWRLRKKAGLNKSVPFKIIAIAAWRRHLGLTQAEVAERLGISQPAYAQQETAERPRKATRERIAKALDIPAPLLDL